MMNKEWFKAKGARVNQYWRQRSVKDRPNIILISLDTLRADHVGCYGYHRDTTPNIDRLAAEGVVFKNAFSTSAWTAPAHMSMLTGLWPMDHGLVRHPNPGVLSEDIPLLSEILWEAGYMTLGFHGGAYLSPHWGFGRGFHVYQTHGQNLEHNLPYAIRWINKLKRRRMFMFFHAFNCHVPYNPPKDCDLFLNGNRSSYDVANMTYLYEKDVPGPSSTEDIEKVIAKYDGGIRYADHLVGVLVLELKRLGIYDDTVIIITADHGDEFWEHGYFGHGKALYEETIRVPIIVAGKWLETNGQSISEDVSLVDIVPTVLGLAGVAGGESFPGVSMLRIRNDPTITKGRELLGSAGYQEEYCEEKVRVPGCSIPRPLLAHYIRRDGWKMLWKVPHGGSCAEQTELYDTNQDPLERNNLATAAASRCKAFYDGLYARGWMGLAGRMSSPSETIDDNEELKGQLKALGYM